MAKLTNDDVDRFLNHRARGKRGEKHERGTRAHSECVLNGLFECLIRQGKVKRNPMDRLQRTRRLPPEALDVTTVASTKVLLMFEAAETWAEELCVTVLAYTGPRRGAAAKLRLTDYDRLRGRLRFQERAAR